MVPVVPIELTKCVIVPCVCSHSSGPEGAHKQSNSPSENKRTVHCLLVFAGRTIIHNNLEGIGVLLDSKQPPPVPV